MTTALERAWYRPRSWALMLLPLSWLFRAVVTSRRKRQSASAAASYRAPVVIVGNITVGGTGKTPLIVALVKALQARGHRPGVISRGYGGAAASYPFVVTAASSPDESGDEPLLIAQSCHCPVVVDPERSRAATHLLDTTDCNVVLSDDGMQHYRLHRDLEIIVVDGERGLGNGQCLPAGPLREPPARLFEAEFCVINGGKGIVVPRLGFRMTLRPLAFRNLADGSVLEPGTPPGSGAVHAVAGIGNPARFARTLVSMGLSVQLHPLPDHHQFVPGDLRFGDDRPVIITAKDAVKCSQFAASDQGPGNVWILDVVARLEDSGLDKLVNRIEELVEQSN